MKVTKRKAVTPVVRFEFDIPDGLPKDKTDMYIWEKVKHICKGLSKRGVKMTPTVPIDYMDR